MDDFTQSNSCATTANSIGYEYGSHHGPLTTDDPEIPD